MKEIFLNKSFNFISSHKELDHYNEVKIKYGLEVMYHFFTKLIVMILLSIIFKVFKEIIIFSLFYMPLRMYGCGIHAKSNIGCWLSSFFTYFVTIVFIKYVFFYKFILYALFCLSFISLCLWAPADTSSKPIVNKKYRLELKIIVLLISLSYLIFSSLINNYYLLKISVFAVLLQSIIVNPITYRLCKRSYNNYKNYNCL